MAYISAYAPLAREQMRKHGIPASITLAQGLLESNIGSSRLAKENNNHFGIKCFSNSCKKGHCTNFSDDSHKDFFRKFSSVAESFQAHSALLKKPRYRSLYSLSRNDYKGWARGLRRAGYATDRSYDAKLIHLIESLELYKYDA
jgi:flagellum-specific peptidoglycan hydrolase FlgJ